MATPRAGSLQETENGAGGELGWLVTPCRPRDEGVDELDEGVDNRVVVDLVLDASGASASLLPACARGAMMRARLG